MSQPSPGSKVELAQFGEMKRWDGKKNFGVEWVAMRKIERVVVHWASQPPEPGGLRLEYWRAFLHDYRTLCAAPTPNLKALFIDLQKLDFDTDDRAVAC